MSRRTSSLPLFALHATRDEGQQYSLVAPERFVPDLLDKRWSGPR